MNMRGGFHDIVSGWMLVHDFNALTNRIEEVTEWMKTNSPLTADEKATIEMMIEVQVVWGFEEFGFNPD